MNIYEDLESKYHSCSNKREAFSEAYEKVKHLEGDFAEFGVYNGGGTRQLASLDPPRTVWAFDTFEGMPKEDYGGDQDKSDDPGKWKPDAPPEKLFEGLTNVRVMKGRFIDTIPLLPSDVKFLVVHLDCDWYASYRQALECLETRLQPGATIFLDEYSENWVGAWKAISEWLERMGSRATGDQSGGKIIWHGDTNP